MKSTGLSIGRVFARGKVPESYKPDGSRGMKKGISSFEKIPLDSLIYNVFHII